MKQQTRATYCRCDNLPHTLCPGQPVLLDRNQASIAPLCTAACYLPLPMPVSKSLLVDSAMILALVLVAVVGYKLSPLLMPRADATANPDPGCDLQLGFCGAPLPGGGRLRFSLTPRPIPVVEPLAVAVEIDGMAAENVSVDFAGVSMNMGFNRPALAQSGPGRFAGQATLPVCVTGRMTWQATVLVESGRQRIAVPFRFEAGH